MNTRAIAVFAVLAPFVQAAGTTALEFLRLGYDARSAALGGISAVMPSGIQGMVGNIAGLGHLSRSSALLTHYEGVEGVRYDYAGFGIPTTMGTWAIGATSARVEGFEGRDVAGYFTNTFSTEGLAIDLQYAYEVKRGIQIGAGLVGFYERLDTVVTRGLAANVGVLFTDDSGVTFGLSIRHAGMPVTYDLSTTPLPTTLNLGILLPIETLSQRFTVLWEGEGTLDEPLKLKTGVEWAMFDLLALRGGVASSFGSGVRWEGRAGGGLKLGGYTMDYAFVPFADFGATHRLTVTSQF